MSHPEAQIMRSLLIKTGIGLTDEQASKLPPNRFRYGIYETEDDRLVDVRALVNYGDKELVLYRYQDDKSFGYYAVDREVFEALVKVDRKTYRRRFSLVVEVPCMSLAVADQAMMNQSKKVWKVLEELQRS